MKKAFIALLFAFGVFSNLPSASAKDAPASAEQLRNAVESALKSKDKNDLLALVNWQGASEDMKSLTTNVLTDMLQSDAVAVKLTALPGGFRPIFERDGIRYTPNVTVMGMIEVDYAGKDNNTKLPYGQKGGAFYIPCTVEEKIPGPITKSKTLSVIVMGSISPDAGKLSGSFVYVQGGKEIKEDINAKGNFSKAFWGEYIKSCTVHKTRADDSPIQLTISENGKAIFESGEVTIRAPLFTKGNNFGDNQQRFLGVHPDCLRCFGISGLWPQNGFLHLSFCIGMDRDCRNV